MSRLLRLVVSRSSARLLTCSAVASPEATSALAAETARCLVTS